MQYNTHNTLCRPEQANAKCANAGCPSFLGGVPTTPDPNTSAKASRYKWEPYRDTNWWCIYYFLPGGGNTFAKVCHRNGSCSAIVFRSIGVRGRFDSPEFLTWWISTKTLAILSGTDDSQRDSRESIRANHSQFKPLFLWRGQADSHESLEYPIRANRVIRANRANRFARITPLRAARLFCVILWNYTWPQEDPTSPL